MISVINYGVGNLGSVCNMLKKIGVSSQVISTKEEVMKATKIILPGVGNFGKAIVKLDELRETILKKVVEDKVPILGICLGMQLLTDGSEESPEVPGLGLIPGYTYKFEKVDEDMRIPHMGWNYVTSAPSNVLISDHQLKSKFYFVHSYYVKTKEENHTIINCKYGNKFAAGIRKDHIYGTQFHPEKSHRFGMDIFENFAKV